MSKRKPKETPADKLAWTVIFRDFKPLTLPRSDVSTLKALADWLTEHGYKPEEVMGVLRSTTKAQALITGMTVKRLMIWNLRAR